MTSEVSLSSSKTVSPVRWYDQKIIPFLPAYSQSMVQVIILSFICFMTSGMYNALTGLGGNGITLEVANNSQTALYSVFCVWGFFAGWLCNVIGTKSCLVFGGTGYCLYSGSLLYFSMYPDTKGAEVFVIFAGAYLGACAGSLWAAQGSIIMSYPPEAKKGRSIMVFWSIFNLGAVIGSAISLGNNLKNSESNATTTTFAVFIALMGSGIIFALCILPGHHVWKDEVGGEKVIQQQYPHWKTELISMAKLLLNEPKIYLLFPLFFASNWFYTYQFNNVNAAKFNIRTRSLNSLIYWLTQMVGASILGSILDWKIMNRKTRAKVGWLIVFVLTMVIWGGGLDFQLQYTRDSVTITKPIDFKDGTTYIGPMFLYFFYGIYDAVFQTFIYYLLGSITNNPKKLAIYSAIYKSIQSAGAAICWRLDYYKIPYMNMFASCWALTGGSLLIAVPLVFFMIENHTNAEDDDMNGEMLNKDTEIIKQDTKENV